jgi:hypothetical protein
VSHEQDHPSGNCFHCATPTPDGYTENGLRVLGWHHYKGPPFRSNDVVVELDRWLCPECLRNKRVAKVATLEGQQDLF